jgi:alkylhydroperoxidase/carboxymuconolactone decarboxylase family protein YurZ
MTDDQVRRGREVMGEIYGQAFADALPEPTSPAQRETMTHLFPEIWTRPGLDIRDRRLVVMGIVAMLGRADLMETQAYGALVNGELTPDQLDEIALQIHFYAGWPNGTQARAGLEAAIRRFGSDTPTGRRA